MERSNKGLQLQAQECKETQMKLESANMMLRSRVQDQESESQQMSQKFNQAYQTLQDQH
jgi:hypothetical protein